MVKRPPTYYWILNYTPIFHGSPINPLNILKKYNIYTPSKTHTQICIKKCVARALLHNIILFFYKKIIIHCPFYISLSLSLFLFILFCLFFVGNFFSIDMKPRSTLPSSGHSFFSFYSL